MRPLRINYENAVYHVMNRGKARQNIFHGKRFTNAFLECLERAYELFGLETIAYCLMSNHYHLLVRTPKANLSRCMRHIGGVYTQHYNRLRKIDGTLFRGRYKAILIEADNYLLQLSRYIHRNPIETKAPLVDDLAKYTLSSYPAYLGQVDKPKWLKTELVLSQFQNTTAYEDYIYDGVDEELQKFYDGKQKLVLGSDNFIQQYEPHLEIAKPEIATHDWPKIITPKHVVDVISKHYQLAPNQLLRHSKSHLKALAIYVCRQHTRHSTQEIAAAFNLKTHSTIAHHVQKIERDLLQDDELAVAYAIIKSELNQLSEIS